MKRLIIIMLAVVCCLSGCSQSKPKSESVLAMEGEPYFAKIYKDANVVIFVDRDTRVMYVTVNNGHGDVEFNPLYNADGSLRLYDGEIN